MIEVVRIPALQDNYIWLVHDPDSGETVVIDPAEAAPVLAEADETRLDDRPDLEHPLAWRSHRRQCRDQGRDRLRR
jgi:glyoxylase-like metal-dependent hydrolase (beta-lactamase superfamily II)